jgi:uncharacterized membrane protein YqaE (UPF0057 family)
MVCYPDEKQGMMCNRKGLNTMIDRRSSLKRDLLTGIILMARMFRGRSDVLFRRRVVSVLRSTLISMIILIPMLVVFIIVGVWGYANANVDGVWRLIITFPILAGLVVWNTHGVFSHELGGVGSETD